MELALFAPNVATGASLWPCTNRANGSADCGITVAVEWRESRASALDAAPTKSSLAMSFVSDHVADNKI